MLGMQGAIVGQGDACKQAIAYVRRVRIQAESFREDVLGITPRGLEAFVCRVFC